MLASAFCLGTEGSASVLRAEGDSKGPVMLEDGKYTAPKDMPQ
jgi:hypothetical protein